MTDGPINENQHGTQADNQKVIITTEITIQNILQSTDSELTMGSQTTGASGPPLNDTGPLYKTAIVPLLDEIERYDVIKDRRRKEPRT